MALQDSLISYYKLDESSGNAADSVGGNTLTNVGTTPYSAAKIYNGAVFDNIASRRLAAGSAVGFTSGGSFTWNLWYKSSVNTGYMLDVITNSGAQRRMTIYNNGTNLAVYTWATDIDTGIAISVGVWYMVTVCWNAGTITTFVNTVAGTGGTTGTGAASGNDFSVGAGYDGFGAKLNGTVDEVGVWSRVLTTSEIQVLYNAGSGLSYPFGTSFKVRKEVRPALFKPGNSK